MQVKKARLTIILLFLIPFCTAGLFAQEKVPFSTLFYRFGYNALGGVTYNYGQNYIISGLGTYALVKTGADWKWNRFAYGRPAMTYAGMPAGIVGFILPVALPLGMYLHGRATLDADEQVSALAMGQAAMLGVLITTTLKAFTGRRPPGLTVWDRDEESDNAEDYSDDFRFGFLRREVFNGWPSSHTAVAFAMAASLTTLYPDNTALKIGAYAYAGLIGFSMSLTVHWASESVSGMLIGYAIGKSVGLGFRGLMSTAPKSNSVAPRPFVSGDAIGVAFRF